MSTRLTRRRAIGVTAAAGLSLVPLVRGARAEPGFVTWRGLLMGAVATLQVHHADRTTAKRGVRKRLRRSDAWKIFSLYREDSALVALNREGSSSPRPETSSSCSENAAAIGS